MYCGGAVHSHAGRASSFVGAADSYTVLQIDLTAYLREGRQDASGHRSAAFSSTVSGQRCRSANETLSGEGCRCHIGDGVDSHIGERDRDSPTVCSFWIRRSRHGWKIHRVCSSHPTTPTQKRHPLYLDVSGDAPWDPHAPTFRDKVTDLAAPIHGKSKYELASDDVREQRRFRRQRFAAIAAFAILIVVAITFAVIAFVQ